MKIGVTVMWKILVLFFVCVPSFSSFAAEDTNKAPLKIEIVITEDPVLSMLPLPIKIKLTNISDADLSILSPHGPSEVGIVAYKMVPLDGGGEGYVPETEEERRVHGDPLISTLYDPIVIKPGESIEKPIQPLWKHYFGFLPGEYSLTVSYGVNGYYAKLYPDVWRGSISCTTKIKIIKPKGDEANAYEKFRKVVPFNDFRSFKRDPAIAADMLEKIIKEYPDTNYALYSHYLLANCYHESTVEEFDKAITALEPILPKLKDKVYYSLAQDRLVTCYWKNNQIEKALSLLEKIDKPEKIKKNEAAYFNDPEKMKKWRERKTDKKGKEPVKEERRRDVMRVLVTFPDAEKIPSLVEYKVKTTEGDTIIVTEKLMVNGEVLWVKFDYPDKQFFEKHKNEDKVTRTAKLADTEGRILVINFTWKKAEKPGDTLFEQLLIGILPEVDPVGVKTVTYTLPTEDGKRVNIEIEFGRELNRE
jgi:hypothetical protein